MNEKQRFWFYSGRHAERLARTKAQGVAGAQVLSRKEAKAQRIALPKNSPTTAATNVWLVVAPAELAPEPEA